MVTTRRQALQARLENSGSPANLGNLPPELIHLIVWQLDRTQPIHCIDNTNEHACDPPPYNDDDCETVVSHDPAEMDPVRGQDCTLTCCREGRTHMVGGEGWRKGERVCVSDSLNLSAASRRLREIIFIDGKKRCRSIRLCDWWREETMKVSETVRNRYKKIKVVANPRHTVDPNGPQLAGLLDCFPDAEAVDFTWELSISNTPDQLQPAPDFPRRFPNLHSLVLLMQPDGSLDAEQYTPRELTMIFQHLRPSRLKSLDLDVADMFGDDRMGEHFVNLKNFFRVADLSRLETLHLRLDFDIMALPVEDLWDALEGVLNTAMDATSLNDILLTPTFVFDNTDEVLQLIFSSTNDNVTLHASVIPSRTRLEDWAKRMKGRKPDLKRFRLRINWDTFVSDDPPPMNNDILVFEYAEPGNVDSVPWAAGRPSDPANRNAGGICTCGTCTCGARSDANAADQTSPSAADGFSYTVNSKDIKVVYDMMKDAPPYILEAQEVPVQPVVAQPPV